MAGPRKEMNMATSPVIVKEMYNDYSDAFWELGATKAHFHCSLKNL